MLTRHYAEYLLNSGEFRESREKRNGKDLCDSKISEKIGTDKYIPSKSPRIKMPSVSLAFCIKLLKYELKRFGVQTFEFLYCFFNSCTATDG